MSDTTQIDVLVSLLDEAAEQHGMHIVRAACRKFMLRRTIAGGGTARKAIPRKWVEAAYLKQGGKCGRCREDLKLGEAVGDHLIALAQGGPHNKRNIRATHARCNSAKGSRTLSEEAKATGQTIEEQLRN